MVEIIDSRHSKIGHWIIDEDERWCWCDCCRFQYEIWNNRSRGLPELFNYCPMCGQDMGIKNYRG